MHRESGRPWHGRVNTHDWVDVTPFLIARRALVPSRILVPGSLAGSHSTPSERWIHTLPPIVWGVIAVHPDGGALPRDTD